MFFRILLKYLIRFWMAPPPPPNINASAVAANDYQISTDGILIQLLKSCKS